MSQTATTDTQTWIAWKRWYVGHHLFFLKFALITYCLQKATEANDDGESRQWVALACDLRRGCGALFIYSVDFEPCPDIYYNAIRRFMPEGFSGYWIQERHYMQPIKNRFERAFEDRNGVRPTILECWESADSRYHVLHENSMDIAVPNGPSLAEEYKQKNRIPHKIKDGEFREYDGWFCIERTKNIDRLDYIFQGCDLMERITADLASGNRLESRVLTELLNGMKAALKVFASWIGPISERSPFYPKVWCGE